MLRQLLLLVLLSPEAIGVAATPSLPWVAYNDHTAGPGTGTNVSCYSLRVNGSGGLLTNQATGAALPVGLRVTSVGNPLWVSLGAMPNAGTPAYNIFHGFADFYTSSSTDNGLALYAISNQTATLTFTNLDPTKRYSFRGTANRNGTDDGKAANNFHLRWVQCSMLGALSFTEAHSTGCVTAASLPASGLGSGQAAFNSGMNTARGDVVGWDDIVPNTNGTVSIVQAQYLGRIWSGETANPANHTPAYGLTAFRLARQPSQIIQIVSQPPASVVVTQGWTANWTVLVDADTPYYQWYHNATPVPSATNATLIIPNAQSGDGGSYYCSITNAFSATNSTTVNLTVTPQAASAILVKAVRTRDFTNLFVTFSSAVSSNVNGSHGSVLNPSNYTIFQTLDRTKTLGVYGWPALSGKGTFLSNGQTTVQFTIDSSLARGLAPNASYTLMATNVADLAGISLVDPSLVAITPQLGFQHGINGYFSCQNAEMTCGTNMGWYAMGTNSPSIWADLTDGAPPDATQGMLRFDDILGPGSGQIPFQARIDTALLTLSSSLPSEGSSTLVNMFLMLTNWAQATASYYSFSTNGVLMDGIQAEASHIASLLPNFSDPGSRGTQRRTVDVTASLQRWANGQANYGWLFNGTSGDGYGFDSILYPVATNHPLLVVDFESTLRITTMPASNHLYVPYGKPFSIAFAFEAGAAQFQWYQDGSLLPGQRSSAIWFAAANMTNVGAYHVQASNSNATIKSPLITVTVTPEIICNSNIVLESAGADGVPASFVVTATDADGLHPVVLCQPGSGTLFFPGITPVLCTATDASGNTSSCSFNVTVLSVNRAPVAYDRGLATSMNRPVVIAAADLLGTDFDPDGDPLTLTVSHTSTNGGTVNLTGSQITYLPPSGFLGQDAFSYTISDGRGGTATAWVQALVVLGALPAPNHSVIGLTTNGFLVRFAGEPGQTCQVQRSPSLAPATWTVLESVDLPLYGILEYEDMNPPPGAAYYRIVTP